MVNSFIPCETWILSKDMEEKLKSLELLLFRRMLKVSWLDKQTLSKTISLQSNEIVLDMFGSHRSLINVITKRQMSFFGHKCRKEKP